jgi:hypothetical protein
MIASPSDFEDVSPPSMVACVATPSVVWFYDNATSVSITPCISELLDVVPLSRTFLLGGVGSGIVVTHRGFLQFLPRRLSLCYYSEHAKASLVCIGLLQSLGCRWCTDGLDHSLLHDRDGTLLDFAKRGTNHLTPVSHARLSAGISPLESPSVVAYVSSPVLFPLYPLLLEPDVVPRCFLL